MMRTESRWTVIAAFALVYLVWGSTYLAVALAVHSIPPFLLMGGRSVVGGTALFVSARLAGSPPVSIADWGRATVCGILFFVTCHGFLAYAQQHVPSGLAAILLATIPFWIALLGTVVPGRNKPSIRQLLLLAPGFLGVAIIVLSDSDFASARSNLGDLFLLVVAAASWALGSILSKRWSPPDEAAACSGMELMAGGTVLLIASTLLGEPASFEPAAVSAAALGAWVYLTVAGTIVTFAAYIWLLTRVSPTLVATYTFVNPVVAVLLGWAVLGERFGGMMAIGAVLVIGSVIGLLWPGQVAKQATSAPHGVHGMVRR
jgi:drug/metabolite transporter (DMT)-like permease